MRFGDRYLLRPASVVDAATVLNDLREEDRLEWAASVAGGVEANLALSIAGSEECYTVSDADDLMAHIIWGVMDAGNPVPMTWLLGTNQGQRDCAWILGLCKEFYTGFFKRWPHTVCMSAPENKVHHRWLQWMGYVQTAKKPWGPYHLPFLEFTRMDREQIRAVNDAMTRETA